ncbi:lipoyl synthase [Elusimicrobiota bacterium]
MASLKLFGKPHWLKKIFSIDTNFQSTSAILRESRLNTVCEEARCPNKSECWSRRTATFMILGKTCTRSCGFCSVGTGKPLKWDKNEPGNVAKAIKKMGLAYAVITSVTRDDMPDGGAHAWAQTVREIRNINPACKVEVLVPDFKGDWGAIKTVIDVCPDVFAHNLETIPEFYPRVRPQANYNRSLCLLKKAKEEGLIAKTGIMLGLGESSEEVVQIMKEARSVGVDIFTMGQYLQPSKESLPVKRYVYPAEFVAYRKKGLALGFAQVEAGPFVRSSYRAESIASDILSIKSELTGNSLN